MNSNEIAEFYRDKLISLGIDNVVVRVIHKNKDICFNSNMREILYAIEESIKYNNRKPFLYYKETIFGKAIVVNAESISTKSVFNDLIFLFIKYYLHRLEMIEKYYDSNYIYFNDLYYKKTQLTMIYNNLIELELPNSVNIIILSYLNFNYSNYIKLRDEYEKRKIK
jgi:hypothetical protein